MPETTRIALSRYRLQKAYDMLLSAKRDLAAEDYASANNRAYYCIFMGCAPFSPLLVKTIENILLLSPGLR